MKSPATLLLMALCVFRVNPLFATTLEELGTKELANESQWIHVGKVASRWSSYDPEKKMVFTYIKLQIDQTLKGESQSEILIRQPGGQDKEFGTVVHGMAHFAPGERTLVFLKQDRDGAPQVVGLTQGKYRIFLNPRTGEEMALHRRPQNVEFVTRGATGFVRHVVNTPEERRIPLRQLLLDIQSVVSQEKKLNP